jgi:endonuclease/exonuclease/phosphatase family metal-dependent hydrolase
VALGLLLWLACAAIAAAQTFRVATYNLENYLDQPAPGRHPKSPEAKAKVRESILAIKPDVLAVEEMGTLSALQELRDSLKAAGSDFPYWEHVTGFDTNIHVAVLSKFPFSARRPHTNECFLLDGRRFHVSRGFAEVEVQVTTNYSFTLIAAHLKSRRAVPEADQAEMRQEEAKLLREQIDARFAADPHANLIVLGDLNDTRNAPSTKTILGRGERRLFDTRPAERNGDDAPAPRRGEPRIVAWTHYYGIEDTYSRIDYILLSPQMARAWVPKESYVLALPNWGVASDHRPVVAAFDITRQSP